MGLADQISSDDDVMLDYRLASEDDVLSRVELGPARDFVAILLEEAEVMSAPVVSD
jgi:hypothetical protein